MGCDIIPFPASNFWVIRPSETCLFDIGGYNTAMVKLFFLSILLLVILLFDRDVKSPKAEERTPFIPQQVVREYVLEEQTTNYQYLLSEFGNNKELPVGYELQALLALSHYPELRDIKIKFVVDDVDIPLSSRPYWASMFRSAKNRTYLVIIDNQREGPRDALLLKRQPFNAQTGIIGHELAHTVYYLDRSLIGILADAACQLNNCRIKFEQDTDKRLVEYGLGWQRYDHSVFIRRSRGISIESAGNSNSAYLSPIELLRLMESHPAYQRTLAQQ